jgi:hypothetical protein
MKDAKNDCKPNAPKSGGAKPYNSPKLINFGAVTRLTRQHLPGPLSDTSGNNMMGRAS